MLVVGFVVLMLPLLAPVSGPGASGEHAFQILHPIFAHHHAAPDGDGHADDEMAVATPLVDLGPLLIPPIPVGPGPLVASEGMLLPSVASLIGLTFLLALARRERPLADQTWMAVPTGPPRRASFA